MLPEEIELQRLETEQQALTEQTVAAELTLETHITELAQFTHRYHHTVGRLYAQLDALDAQLAAAQAAQQPHSEALQQEAARKAAQAQASAQEAGISEHAEPAVAITPELRQTFRKAAGLMHPDRATTEPERQRREALMKQVNAAYEKGDMAALQQLITHFGQDPEAITGTDLGSRMVKAIRRISQLRRRLGEVDTALNQLEASEMYQLKVTVQEAEALGGTPLEDLAQGLLQDISERKIALTRLSATVP